MDRCLPQFAGLFVLTLAVAMDLNCRRIPNWITVPAILVAWVYHGAEYGPVQGIAQSTAGLALGCALLILPFAMGGMGGGDVKLLGALGAWLGGRSILNVFIYAAWAGGLWALIVMIRNGTLVPRLVKLWPHRRSKCYDDGPKQTPADEETIPYAAAIGAGYLVFLTYGGLV